MSSMWVPILISIFAVPHAALAQPTTKSPEDKALAAKACVFEGDEVGKLEVTLDAASVQAALAKVQSSYKPETAVALAGSRCDEVSTMLERLCHAAGKTLAAKVKRVRCVVTDSKSAPQQALRDGTWVVTYSLWTRTSDLFASKAGFEMTEGAVVVGLAKTLGVDPKLETKPDSSFSAPPGENLARCTSAKDCSANQLCGSSDDSDTPGPRCVVSYATKLTKTQVTRCTKDSQCPSDSYCDMRGIPISHGKPVSDGACQTKAARREADAYQPPSTGTTTGSKQTKSKKQEGDPCTYTSECESRPGMRCTRPRGAASKVQSTCMLKGY